MPLDDHALRRRLTRKWRLTRDGESRNAIGALRLGGCAVAEHKEKTVGAIARMEHNAIDKAIAHFEKCFDLIGPRVIAQAKDFRGPFFFAALLNDQKRAGVRLGRDKDRRAPMDVRESLFDRVGQRRIRRADHTRSGPGNSVVDAVRWFGGGVKGAMSKSSKFKAKENDQTRSSATGRSHKNLGFEGWSFSGAWSLELGVFHCSAHGRIGGGAGGSVHRQIC